jgi:two-component system sensor histidine kinase ArlS
MKIKNRLTLNFVWVVSLLLAIFSIVIYFISSSYRKDEFSTRLYEKGLSTAILLLEENDIDAELLNKIEKNNPINLYWEEIIIYTNEWKVLYKSKDSLTYYPAISILESLKQKEFIIPKHSNRDVYIFKYQLDTEEYYVCASAEDLYGLSKLQTLKRSLFLVAGLSVVFFFFIGMWFSGRALKPLSELASKIEGLDMQNIEGAKVELLNNSKDEISILIHAFNSALERVEKSIHSQKHFVANASHELRTPLTSIIGEIEVLLIKERNTEEYKQALQSVLEDMLKLNSVANNLLLLAKTNFEIESDKFKIQRIDELIWQVISEIKKNRTDATIHFNLDETLEEEGDLSIHANPILLQTALANIIENGCKYSDNNTAVIFVEKAKNHVIVRVRDHGMGIDKEELEFIFQPFFRSKKAIKVKGHGIGLSLVEKIIKLHGGSISVVSIPGDYTEFSVFLPLS